MTKKPDIIPVQLTDNTENHSAYSVKPQVSRSKLVARIRFSHSELFLYEDIKDETLQVLLSEMNKL